MFLSVVLIAIAIVALVSIMTMTGRFGWSLQEVEADRYVSAVVHVLVELAAAALMFAAAFCLCTRGGAWKAVGLVAGFCSVALVLYSVLSVYSFMSVRIARVEAHDDLIAEQKKSLAWNRGVSIKRDVPRSERLYLRQETRDAQSRLEQTLAIIPDAPARSLADLFSTTLLRMQRVLVIIASCIGQVIMEACLFVGVFIWPRRTSPRQPSSPRTGGDGGERKPKLVTNNAAKPVPAGAAAMTASSPVAMLAGSDGEMARTVPGRGRIVKGAHLPDGVSKDLRDAADWFVKGGSPWRSIRHLASEFECHHRTAGEYVQRAQGRRKASQQLTTDRRRSAALTGFTAGGIGRLAGTVHAPAIG